MRAVTSKRGDECREVAGRRSVAQAVPLNRFVLFFAIAAAGCLADLATKQWIFNWLGMPGENPTRWLWRDVFGVQTSLNQGALFGMGQGWVVLFTVLSILVIPGIFCWLFFARAARDLLLTVAAGLVTAGILGNLYDRLGLPGLRWNYANAYHNVGDPVYAVRDWILMMIGNYHWPNYNVADSMLVCGAILLVWHALRCETQKRPHPNAAQ